MDDEQLLISYLKKKGCSKRSIETYNRAFKKFMSWLESRHLESENVTYSELLDYIAWLRKRNVTQRTIQNYLLGITHYYEALVKAEVITTNPGKYITLKVQPTKKLYPILSKEQLENLYTTFEVKAYRKTKPTAHASAMRNKVIIGLVIYQGLTVTTLAELTINDVDVLGGTIRIKGGRKYATRTLPLQARQIIELDRYINQTRKELQQAFDQEESDLLLIHGYANYGDLHNQRIMRRLKKKEPQLQSMQHIRASVITHWLKQYNLREVQYMAGHKRLLRTEAYLQNDTEGLQLDIDRFHPMG
ncbi:MAG: tyrosine-type recombinase/integrase [Bacteroidota bacterium]